VLRSSLSVSPLRIFVLATMCLAISGCGPDETALPEPTRPAVEGIRPIIDREIGIATSGSHRYFPSEYLGDEVGSASIQVMEECYREHGTDVFSTEDLMVNSVGPAYSQVGVWRIEEAEQFAFMKPLAIDDQIENAIPNTTLSDSLRAEAEVKRGLRREESERVKDFVESGAHEAILADCLKDDEVAYWRALGDEVLPSTLGPWVDEFAAANEEAQFDDRMLEIREEFAECLKDQKMRLVPIELTPNETFGDLFVVEGQDARRVDEQQIKLAIEVVRCKDEVSAIERVLNIVAEYEEPIYLEYEDELQETQRVLEDIEARTESFWSTRE